MMTSIIKSKALDVLSKIISRLLPIGEIADLRVPVYVSGEMLVSPWGETCVILDVNPEGKTGVEYSVLWDSEVHSTVSENALAGWNVLSESEHDTFMLSF